MAIIARTKTGVDFSVAPEALHAAVCVDVLDLGLVKTQWGESYQVEIRWQLEDIDPKSEKPYMVLRRFRNSLHEKSALRPFLESWRGRKFTEEELAGFDLERLLGANCQAQIIHHIKSDGQKFANVQSVVPPAKGQVKLAPRDYIRKKDRVNDNRSDADDSDEAVPF